MKKVIFILKVFLWGIASLSARNIVLFADTTQSHLNITPADVLYVKPPTIPQVGGIHTFNFIPSSSFPLTEQKTKNSFVQSSALLPENTIRIITKRKKLGRLKYTLSPAEDIFLYESLPKLKARKRKVPT
jgi:hypothetical protein